MDKKSLQIANSIFFKGSRTYSLSSIFFPSRQFKWVSVFYAFVRVIDNLVDESPVQSKAFYRFKENYMQTITGKKSQIPLIANLVELQKRFGIDSKFILPFFESMEFDLHQPFVLDTIDDSIKYMYGSAEVIGIIMAKILDLPAESHAYGQRIGRAMQYVNFLRDIREDYSIGRVYIPKSHAYIKKLDSEHLVSYQEYDEFIRNELFRYLDWLYEGLYGLCYIPRTYAIPVLTSIMMYHRIAQEVFKSPSTMYYAPKFRPSKFMVLYKGLQNLISYPSHGFAIHSLRKKFNFNLV